MTTRELVEKIMSSLEYDDIRMINYAESSEYLAHVNPEDMPKDVTPETFRTAWNDAATLEVTFSDFEEHGYRVNYMTCHQFPQLFARIRCPAGASDTFGYSWLKDSIIATAESIGIDTARLEFWFDGMNIPPREIGIDKLSRVCTPGEAVSTVKWQDIVIGMKSEYVRQVVMEGITDKTAFVSRYLEVSPYDIICGVM